jgi:hypothetical protein
MTICSELSPIVLPLISQFSPNSVLLIGELASTCFKADHNTRSHSITTPTNTDLLKPLETFDVAVITDLTSTLTKKEASEWIGLIRNSHAVHIVLTHRPNIHRPNEWELTDFIALGFKKITNVGNYEIYTYAIESYQIKKDWLNNRYWANPENFDKFRW